MAAQPPVPAADAEDAAQLRLLGIFHYVVAGLCGLFALFPVFHLAIGVGIVSGAMPVQDPQARWMGWFFIAFASAWMLCGLALAVAIAVAGRCLQRHRRYTYCLVVAGLSCMLMPFGTVLGVFTLIVLVRPRVKTLFEGTAAP